MSTFWPAAAMRESAQAQELTRTAWLVKFLRHQAAVQRRDDVHEPITRILAGDTTTALRRARMRACAEQLQVWDALVKPGVTFSAAFDSTFGKEQHENGDGL